MNINYKLDEGHRNSPLDGVVLRGPNNPNCDCDLKPVLCHPDYVWSDCLMRLRVHDATINHFLAWLSTLGGAYHLCDHPKQAMAIARMTLCVGQYICSARLALKGYVYLAVNYCMLGKSSLSLNIIDGCLAYIDAQIERGGASESWTSIREFVDANKIWIVKRILERRKTAQHLEN